MQTGTELFNTDVTSLISAWESIDDGRGGERRESNALRVPGEPRRGRRVSREFTDEL